MRPKIRTLTIEQFLPEARSRYNSMRDLSSAAEAFTLDFDPLSLAEARLVRKLCYPTENSLHHTTSSTGDAIRMNHDSLATWDP